MDLANSLLKLNIATVATSPPAQNERGRLDDFKMTKFVVSLFAYSFKVLNMDSDISAFKALSFLGLFSVITLAVS